MIEFDITLFFFLINSCCKINCHVLVMIFMMLLHFGDDTGDHRCYEAGRGGQLKPQSSDVLLHPHLYKIRTSINGLRGLSVMGSGSGRLL